MEQKHKENCQCDECCENKRLHAEFLAEKMGFPNRPVMPKKDASFDAEENQVA